MNTLIGNNLNILLKKIKVHHGRIETIEFRPTRAIFKKNMESKNPFEINGKKKEGRSEGNRTRIRSKKKGKEAKVKDYLYFIRC